MHSIKQNTSHTLTDFQKDPHFSKLKYVPHIGDDREAKTIKNIDFEYLGYRALPRAKRGWINLRKSL